MADHADDDEYDGEFFIYRRGWVPQLVTHVLIDESVDEIEENAFICRDSLVHVKTHNGLRKIGKYAFQRCTSLRWIDLKSVVEIDRGAFGRCESLETLEFGDRLETIRFRAFCGCTSLAHLKLPSVITIEEGSFTSCTNLLDVELSEQLETIEGCAFSECESLQRIAIPLKRNLFAFHDFWRKYTQFEECEQLRTVDLVGGIHTTVASLHMESWRTEMTAEIKRINQVLTDTSKSDKTEEIRQWMLLVIGKMDCYKAEHNRYVKEGITLLELALWKVKLDEQEVSSDDTKVDDDSARRERRITCGADIVIKNVLPFLKLLV